MSLTTDIFYASIKTNEIIVFFLSDESINDVVKRMFVDTGCYPKMLLQRP